MNTSYIPADLRRLVAERARGLCEYCLIHEDDTYYGCQIDHVISKKHGGGTNSQNLGYACTFCNRNKGSDIGSLSEFTGNLVRFYNPRTDHWWNHFQLDGVTIVPLTEIGAATVRIFGFNHPDRLLERQELAAAGRYPVVAAQDLLAGGLRPD